MMLNDPQTVQFETVQAPNGSSMYMDLALPNHIARVTAGQLDAVRGYCDTEILNTETEEAVERQHHEFSSAPELNAILADFFSHLRDLPDAGLPMDGATFMLPLADQNVRLNSLLVPPRAAGG